MKIFVEEITKREELKMGFFSDLGKKTSETTGKIAKETKLKLKINDNKGKFKKLRGGSTQI